MITESRNTKGYWIWGGFEQNDKLFIDTIKFKINKKLKGPIFDSHLTFSGPIKELDESILDRFYRLKETIHPIKLNINTISFNKDYYRSIYLDIENGPNLGKFKDQIDSTFQLISNDYSPHISLYYGYKNIKIKKKAISNLPKLPTQIKLDKLFFVYVNEIKKVWDIREILLLE